MNASGDSMTIDNRAVATDRDHIREYLATLGRGALLTASQEVELAETIESGIVAQATLDEYVREHGAAPLPLRMAIAKVSQQAHDARERLILENQRLVVSIVKRYLGRGLGVMDLIQEGHTGLMRAAEKFDYRKGNRFSTYATWWIRQSITRALADQSRSIRLPVHMHDFVNQLRVVKAALEVQLERTPDEQELAAVTGVSVRRVQRALEGMHGTMSLDAPTSSDDEITLGEKCRDTHALPHECAEYAMLGNDLAAAFVWLSAQPGGERQTQVLRLRFGLGTGEKSTLQQVGNVLGITRERARQVQDEGLDLLRQHCSHLQDYLY